MTHLFYGLIILIYAITSLGNDQCEEFFNQKANELGIGRFTDSNSALSPIFEYEKGKFPYKMSGTPKLGRRDPGPTILVYDQGEDFKVSQLFLKDLKTKKFTRFMYFLNKDCESFSEVVYNNDGKQVNLTQEKCNDIEKNFITDEIVMGVVKICGDYFSKSKQTENSSEKVDNKSSAASPQ